MSTQSILVLGATGTTGRRVAELLRAGGHLVRAASRHGEVLFDWSDPDTWDAAVGEATALYLMAPDGTPVDPTFVDRAVSRGVRRIVLLSSRAIEPMGDQRLLDAEATVRGSDAVWTIVRSSWFDQNFDEGFLREAILAGEVAMPLGQAGQAFVDAGDIAAVAAAALVEDGHEGRTYEVTGPRALSFGEAVEIIGSVIGRTIRYGGTAEAFAASQTAFGVPEPEVAGAVQAFDALKALGDEEPTDVVRRITGREPKEFATYAAEAAATGVWGGRPPV